MVVRRELLRGLERLDATTTVLQRARLADPLGGMWEAADVQWWWRRPRATDELALPVWFDEVGPVAAAGLTAWDDAWQADVFAVPSIVDLDDVWVATLEATAGHGGEALQLLVREDDAPLVALAMQSGFAMTDELSGTTWMDADQRPPVVQVDGFAVVDRVTRADRPHPMIARNGELVEPRLRQCSLYDPTLDLAVEDADGGVAGYALFWFDHTTLVGLLEPMRVEDDYQRRGLARMLLTTGLDRLARKGARRLKVGFATDAARHLYVGAGFVQTSIDRLLIRPAPSVGTGRLPRVADEDEELAAFADWSASYGSGALTLPAFFVAPAGDGPFPAVVFHHGSSGLLGAARGGAEALVAMGYAVLLAVRRGHNGAPGVFWETRVTAPWGSPQMGPQLVEALEDECDDALAALAWVKEQPMVDAARVAMIGSSYGGVMVMLAARRRAAFRAGISFAGPSITWPDAPALQNVLLDAMRTTEVPLFLVQAADDVHLTPTYALGSELARCGKVHEVRIYGPIGENPGDGHGIFNKAVDLWRPDVDRFLSRWTG